MKRYDAEEPPHWDWADEVDIVVADADDGEFPDEYLDLSWQFEEFWEANCWGRGCLPSFGFQIERQCVGRWHSAKCQVHYGETCIHFIVLGRVVGWVRTV